MRLAILLGQGTITERATKNLPPAQLGLSLEHTDSCPFLFFAVMTQNCHINTRAVALAAHVPPLSPTACEGCRPRVQAPSCRARGRLLTLPAPQHQHICYPRAKIITCEVSRPKGTHLPPSQRSRVQAGGASRGGCSAPSGSAQARCRFLSHCVHKNRSQPGQRREA